MSDVEIPESADLNYFEIARVLNELQERYYEDGDEMAYPSDWWNERIGTLAIRVETKARLVWLTHE